MCPKWRGLEGKEDWPGMGEVRGVSPERDVVMMLTNNSKSPGQPLGSHPKFFTREGVKLHFGNLVRVVNSSRKRTRTLLQGVLQEQ